MNVKELIADMESKTPESRPTPRPRTQNNPRPRTDPLEAKDQKSRTQGLDTIVSKKKVFLNLPQGLWRILQDEEKKKVMTLAHLLQIKK